MKILCVGDSLTYGFGVQRSKTWVSLSKKELGIEILNEGINGDTTGGMISRFNDSIKREKPDVVFIMGGANDLIAGASLGIVQANIMSMSHQAISKLITPIIGIPIKMDIKKIRGDWYSFTDFNKISNELEQYKVWIKKFCKTFNVKYVDFDLEIDNLSKVNDLYLDGLHLNEEGHNIMAKIFCDSIRSII
ncbi:lysophospholipase L1-like esterase [Sedimentibacter acidaminivorans]|uniref:Lysophospholipase L1-like esterase n=1 Tax=Sedimentibacter acidaminivorans TaxID=913099 RepID=A0ABS4GDY4_9FIRM|nr:GDSL-type esterase/lipase family protein [Sedimentibacter acidaminivorans]MBP1925904.1 lysophospholipase L1-like esterase [Sedimentibacter acidaminivorans]